MSGTKTPVLLIGIHTAAEPPPPLWLGVTGGEASPPRDMPLCWWLLCPPRCCWGWLSPSVVRWAGPLAPPAPGDRCPRGDAPVSPACWGTDSAWLSPPRPKDERSVWDSDLVCWTAAPDGPGAAEDDTSWVLNVGSIALSNPCCSSCFAVGRSPAGAKHNLMTSLKSTWSSSNRSTASGSNPPRARSRTSSAVAHSMYGSSSDTSSSIVIPNA
mmetsp:Transcript_29161/g.93145  ORF Transcript_29161/g.93145 Transcript_29161/m.93145 type:complete len:213 (+) Transcript_29161:418-1056(+)